jgi:hypothetical protein
LYLKSTYTVLLNVFNFTSQGRNQK